jgi:hypothetical protein
MNPFPFNPKRGPIVVRAEATGPTRNTNLDFLRDEVLTIDFRLGQINLP